MKKYELTLLFSIRDDLFRSGTESVREIVNGLGAVITKEEDLGERPLAYPILKEKQGHYLFWAIDLPSTSVDSLKESLQNHEAVLRFLIVKGAKDTKK